MTPESQQLMKAAMEKGTSSWLSALPIKAIGYALNKQEYTDAICMRYGWKVKGIPTHCACGETNSVDHSLICKLGGYISMRHNSVRDSEAQIMREVCRDVQIEPTLLPSLKMAIKEKPTLLTIQGWISLREDCGIAVRKLPLT